MIRLMMILYSMVATVLAGMGVIAVLSTGNGTWQMICAAAAVGFALAIPASWFAAKQMIGKLA